MKNIRRVYSFLVLMLMVCVFSVTTYAADRSTDTDAFVDSFVIDESDVLNDSEEEKLDKKLKEIYDDSKFGIYIVYIDKVPDGRDVQAYADDIYDASECGYGTEGSGAMLLVCTGSGDRCISSKGDGVDAFPSGAVSYVGKKMAKTISEDDYYKTATIFVDDSKDFVERSRAGKKIVPVNWPKTIAVSVVIAFIISLIIVGVMISNLKTVRKQDRADYYTRSGSMKVTASREFFLYRKVDRTRKAQNSSDGHSTAHTSSSGSTHGGGKF